MNSNTTQPEVDVEGLEREILGLAMTSVRALRDLGQVRPEHFYSPQAATVWQLITKMDSQGKAITIRTVAAELKSIPEDERRGITPLWIRDCASIYQVPAEAETHAKQLINQAGLRSLREAVSKSFQVLQNSTDAGEATELVRTLIDDTVPEANKGLLLADTMPRSIERFDEETRIIPTPWQSVDAIIGGWRPGALYVIGARPGAGKTIFGVQAALGLAQWGPVALNSLEMSAHEINQRIVSHTADVFISRLQGRIGGRSRLEAMDRKGIDITTPALMELPLSVDSRRGISPLDVRAHARSLSRKGPLAGIVVDYIQLLRPHDKSRRPQHEVIAEFSQSLKELAGEMDCPVIALAQLNRDGAERPSVTNLKGSGSLEQDADVVMLLSVPEDRAEDGTITLRERELTITVAKNRHGAPGTINLQRTGAKSTIGPLNSRGPSQEGPF